jgi:hypothetical protein
MVRAIPRVTAWLTVLLLFAGGAVMADTANLTFVDGNTVSGTFAYDVTQDKIVSWNFTSTEFNGTTFNSASANGQCFGFPCGGFALTNPNGDVVFGFDAAQPNANNAADELDIVISCGGVQNCVQSILLSLVGNGVGNSFAIAAGQPTGCTGAITCIASGEQQDIFNCLGASCQVLLGANNFLTITDPPSPGDVIVDMTLSNVPVGTVLTGGGGNAGVPEPSTLLLSSLGFAALALKRFYA